MVIYVVIERRFNFVKNVITGGVYRLCSYLVLGFTAWQKRCVSSETRYYALARAVLELQKLIYFRSFLDLDKVV